MTDTRSRVPAGVTTGGQFATEARGESDVALGPGPAGGAGTPAHAYLTSLVSTLGLKGEVSIDEDAYGSWGYVTVTSDAGDKLQLGTHLGGQDRWPSGLSVRLHPDEDGPGYMGLQDFDSSMYGGALYDATAQSTVRSVVIAAGMAEVAAGRFDREDDEHAVRKVRLGARPEESSWRYATDAEYDLAPTLYGEVDGEELAIEVGEDRLSVRVGQLEANDAPDYVRDLVGKDLCARLGIDPGDDGLHAISATLTDLQDQARESDIYRRFFD